MNKTTQILCLLAILILSSCASRRTLVYLQDMEELNVYPFYHKYDAVFQRDDRLCITVSCKYPELTLPFNIPGSSDYSVGMDGEVTAVMPATPGTDNTNKPCLQVVYNSGGTAVG